MSLDTTTLYFVATMVAALLGAMLSLALNALGFVACGMVWNAARVFHGRKPNLPGLMLGAVAWVAAVMALRPEASADRKSTRLNSSHDQISYAVFCLKKKKKKKTTFCLKKKKKTYNL